MGNKLFIYQINTWVWLNTLSRKYGETITLENVPEVELEVLGQLNIDMIWMMGVWQRSPAARLNALKYKHEYRGALPDLTDDDVIGSAYASSIMSSMTGSVDDRGWRIFGGVCASGDCS